MHVRLRPWSGWRARRRNPQWPALVVECGDPDGVWLGERGPPHNAAGDSCPTGPAGGHRPVTATCAVSSPIKMQSVPRPSAGVIGSCRKSAAIATLVGGIMYWKAEAAAAEVCFSP